MNTLEKLRKITTKYELANLIEVEASTLTYVLYVLKPETQYTSFTIPKRNGGSRTIFAPSDKLKYIQSHLSKLLQNCIDDINKSKPSNNSKSTLSHGFVRKRSIITNAMMHLNKKNVLNIDLINFFDSFNFGRVRGFFIANNNFKLHPQIATVIAQIACYEDKLPQGSPCSPVITNLITHSLDIRLASLARRYSCTYSRYADDITFSSREAIFPTKIMDEDSKGYVAGKKLRSEIRRSGFEINEKKTRIQYRDSRQDVTGLIVNRKPNVKKEYWRTVRSQCHALFQTGEFEQEVNGSLIAGNINVLEGKLNFIDQIDRHNRQRPKKPLNPEYAHSNHGFNTKKLLNGRETTFSRFLYYRLFHGNTKPTILCEGQTDNIYLKSALKILANEFPELAKVKTNTTPYELLIRFVKYSKRTRFLLQLYGGTSYLNYFIGLFDSHFKFYKAPKPKHPVIIVLDNDSGFKGKKDSGIEGKLLNIDSATSHPLTLAKNDFRKSEFIHVIHNLYIILTPLNLKGDATAIEDLFDENTLKTKIAGKSFNPKNEIDTTKEYGKEIFSTMVIQAQKNTVNFDGFRPLLSRIIKAINHYHSQADK